jgi:hypothetical protein
MAAMTIIVVFQKLNVEQYIVSAVHPPVVMATLAVRVWLQINIVIPPPAAFITLLPHLLVVPLDVHQVQVVKEEQVATQMELPVPTDMVVDMTALPLPPQVIKRVNN